MATNEFKWSPKRVPMLTIRLLSVVVAVVALMSATEQVAKAQFMARPMLSPPVIAPPVVVPQLSLPTSNYNLSVSHIPVVVLPPPPPPPQLYFPPVVVPRERRDDRYVPTAPIQLGTSLNSSKTSYQPPPQVVQSNSFVSTRSASQAVVTTQSPSPAEPTTAVTPTSNVKDNTPEPAKSNGYLWLGGIGIGLLALIGASSRS